MHNIVCVTCLLIELRRVHNVHYSGWRDFLGYFDTWRREINSSDCSASEKRIMCISDETLQGIRMTGVYLVCINMIIMCV